MYEYKALVTKVYDGDTITVDIDLGLGVWLKDQKLRLFGINAPEMRGEEKVAGTFSRDFLREQILNKEVKIKTIKDKKGKYGRYLATVYLSGKNLNQLMVAEGYAQFKDY